MKCPYCDTPNSIPESALGNVYHYHNSVTVASICCGQPVRLSENMQYEVRKFKTERTEDDWGTPYKITTPPRDKDSILADIASRFTIQDIDEAGIKRLRADLKKENLEDCYANALDHIVKRHFQTTGTIK